MKKLFVFAALFAGIYCGFAYFAGAGAAPGPDRTATVYFSKEISPTRLKALYQKLEFKPAGKLGVKVHFGEKGNENYIPPALLKGLVTELKGTFVETNTLYGGSRGDTRGGGGAAGNLAARGGRGRERRRGSVAQGARLDPRRGVCAELPGSRSKDARWRADDGRNDAHALEIRATARSGA